VVILAAAADILAVEVEVLLGAVVLQVVVVHQVAGKIGIIIGFKSLKCMKHLLLIALSFIFNSTIYSQKNLPVNKKNTPRKMQTYTPQKIKQNNGLPNLYANYVFLRFQPIIKVQLKKKQITTLNNSVFAISKNGITSKNKVLNHIVFSIFEVEKMKKDDYLYRCFQTITQINLIDIPETFSVHKTNNQNIFGIIQLLNGQIIFPYKGGLIYAERKAS
jgi:hypothetical protein